jgi:hypothetical protein
MGTSSRLTRSSRGASFVYEAGSSLSLANSVVASAVLKTDVRPRRKGIERSRRTGHSLCLPMLNASAFFLTLADF